ncbi:MAG: hypothetical protein M0Z46_03395 [Actinomycetota bacterium]|jgi:hypothetical protein|nr:hypothetical protein [Actinomycetota bacterium]
MSTRGDGRRRFGWPWGSRRPSGDEQLDEEEGDDVAELIAECEAYVVGGYAEHLGRHAEQIPVWAWTNLLAHGSREDLVRAAREVHSIWSPSRQWRVARGLIAREVLNELAHGASLFDVQREVLAPIELAIASHPGAWTWTPQRWLDTVRSALHGALGRRS